MRLYTVPYVSVTVSIANTFSSEILLLHLETHTCTACPKNYDLISPICGESNCREHDDVIKWKHFPRYWAFVWGIHRSPLNSPQRPVARSFDVFYDLRLNKRLSKQARRWWFEMPSRSLWRHCNEIAIWRGRFGEARLLNLCLWLILIGRS